MVSGELREEGGARVPGVMYKQWWADGEQLCENMGE